MVEEHENELVAEAARRHLGSEIAAERRAQLARRVRELVGRLRGK